MNDILEDKKNAILMILVALTKVSGSTHRKTQKWARKEMRKKLMDSEPMMNAFKEDCKLAKSREGLPRTRIQLYYEYIYASPAVSHKKVYVN